MGPAGAGAADRRAGARVFLAAAAVLLLASLADAQDAHYWTYGYGPVGQLTEGTIVGGVNDLSATYYNPAALALIDDPRFVLGLNSIELAHIDVPGAAGAGLNLDSKVFDVVPSLVAGRFGGDDDRADRFAYAFLSRHDTDWDLGYTRVAVTSAPDAAAGFGRVRQRLVEYWAGGTWSHRLRPGLSIGISPFVAYRAQRSRRSLTLESTGAAGASTAFVAREDEYNHGRALAKLGLAWRTGPWQLGLTGTTPSLRLYHKGKVTWNAAVDTPDTTPLLSASAQEGLDATYHAPWSVASGATWRGRRTTVHTTAEWFSQVEPYDILQPEPAPIAGSDETIPLAFVGEARAVLNYGVGLEQKLAERVTLYAGAARNSSTWGRLAETLASWDLTDATAGVTLARGRARLALGLGYAWGHGEVPRVIEVPGQRSTADPVRASFSRWTLSVGASFADR